MAEASTANTAATSTDGVDDSMLSAAGSDAPNNTATPTNEASPATDATTGNGDDEQQQEQLRIGSISSARFNILSTMVGGGCLSLPLAFSQSGNAGVGPLMLIGTGLVTNFCFDKLVQTSRRIHPPHPTVSGVDTFESITSEAFGPVANVLSMGLVVLMCFFGTVGYSVLLRDMVEPLNDWILSAVLKVEKDSVSASRIALWWHKNFTMFLVVFLVTPFCTLRRLTALKDCGALSMLSLLILGTCIVIRSVQCNLGGGDAGGANGDSYDLLSDFLEDDHHDPWYTHLSFFPDSWHDLLNALPLYISCFVCHYNILPVHNELKDPTPTRVSWWLSSTTWFAVALYMVMGFAGSAYAHCTPTGTIQGNILLDFDEHDPLLMVGRMCLAVTITLAFPMLVIPGRDIVVRSLLLPRLQSRAAARASATLQIDDEELAEPLLEGQGLEPSNQDAVAVAGSSGDLSSISFGILLSISVVIFWSAAALASLVSSIDVVWDLLGSSLSILMSYLIPAGTYLVISAKHDSSTTESSPEGSPEDETGNTTTTTSNKATRLACWLLLGVSVPLMVVSTANAVYNTFFEKR